MPLLVLENVSGNSTAPVAKKFSICGNNIHFVSESLDKKPIGSTKEPWVILGHSACSDFNGFEECIKIGGLTAKQMAEEFAGRINEKDRNNLRDIYFLACEVGWRTKNGYFYVDDFANQLYLLGFKKAIIHAISPEEIPNDSEGIRLLINNTADSNHVNYGHIKAIHVTKEYEELEEQYTRLIKKQKNYQVQNKFSLTLEEQIKATVQSLRKLENQLEIVENTNIKEDLDKDEFSFKSQFYVNDLAQEAEVRKYYKPRQRFCLFRARSKCSESTGDELKFEILVEFYKELVTKKTEEEVRNFVQQKKANSEDYMIINRSQGLLTWMFALFINTRSKAAWNNMIEAKIASFNM